MRSSLILKSGISTYIQLRQAEISADCRVPELNSNSLDKPYSIRIHLLNPKLDQKLINSYEFDNFSLFE